MAASVGMTGRVGRESSVCTGANSSPPHSAMRLLFEVCQEVGFCPRVGYARFGGQNSYGHDQKRDRDEDDVSQLPSRCNFPDGLHIEHF